MTRLGPEWIRLWQSNHARGCFVWDASAEARRGGPRDPHRAGDRSGELEVELRRQRDDRVRRRSEHVHSRRRRLYRLAYGPADARCPRRCDRRVRPPQGCVRGRARRAAGMAGPGDARRNARGGAALRPDLARYLRSLTAAYQLPLAPVSAHDDLQAVVAALAAAAAVGGPGIPEPKGAPASLIAHAGSPLRIEGYIWDVSPSPAHPA